MAKGGRKYRLLMYEHMLNRWWPVTLWIAVFIFLNTGFLWWAEQHFGPGENPFPVLSIVNVGVMFAVGVICLLFTLSLLILRKLAYIQLFDDHLRMVTPFMRLNVSYKRVINTVTTQMVEVFDPRRLSGWSRNIIEPVLGRTVVVLHLTSYPLPRSVLKLFLSPFFFSDRSPHFVLFLDDWMRFSTELDSRRSQGKTNNRQKLQSPHGVYGLLDDLKRK